MINPTQVYTTPTQQSSHSSTILQPGAIGKSLDNRTRSQVSSPETADPTAPSSLSATLTKSTDLAGLADAEATLTELLRKLPIGSSRARQLFALRAEARLLIQNRSQTESIPGPPDAGASASTAGGAA